MGRGGDASGRSGRFPAEVADARVPPRLPEARPPFTIADLKRAIPPHCFKRSLWRSSAYLAADVAAAAALFVAIRAADAAALPPAARLAAWLLYWVAQGAVCTGIWVVAHECGHGAFSEYALVNDAVGFVAHSALLVPYFSWKFSHRRHHAGTGSLERDEVFVPPKRAELPGGPWLKTAPGRALHILITLTVGWPLYLAINAAGRKYPPGLVNHFWPWAPIFNARERALVALSDAGLLAACAALRAAARAAGAARVFALYGVPYLIVNGWLVLITLLQHTHPSLPHFEGDEWEWLRGALCTVDRSYGRVLDTLHHHIADTHVVHHLFSALPHYHAQEATRAVRGVLGKYYLFDARPVALALWQDWRSCAWVEQDAGGAPGVLWFRGGHPATEGKAQ